MKIFVNVIHDNDIFECRVFLDIRSFLEFADELTYEYFPEGFDESEVD